MRACASSSSSAQARHGEARAHQSASGLARRRSAALPCVPPYCAVDCAFADAGTEARVAADFIAADAELSALSAHHPEHAAAARYERYPRFVFYF